MQLHVLSHGSCMFWARRRPTYFPSSRLQPRRSCDAASLSLASYVSTLAELAAPKAALSLLHDDVRLEGYEAGMRAALEELIGDSCMQHLCQVTRACSTWLARQNMLDQQYTLDIRRQGLTCTPRPGYVSTFKLSMTIS